MKSLSEGYAAANIGALAIGAGVLTGGLATAGTAGLFGSGFTAGIVGGAAGGFAGGFIGGAGIAGAMGANFDEAMKAGWKAGLSGAAGGAVGGAFGVLAKGVQVTGFWSGAAKYGIEGAGAFGRGFTGGYTFGRLNGMSGDDALNFAVRGGAISLGAYALGQLSPFRLTLRPNAAREAPCGGKACMFGDGELSVGPKGAEAFGIRTGDHTLAAKFVDRYVPMADSMSNMHDDMLDILTEGTEFAGKAGTAMPDILNYGTMIPAAGFTAYDMALTLTENYGYMWR